MTGKIAKGTSLFLSKALRCTFFWENLCSSKFVQLELLNKAKARSWKKPCSIRFSLHKSMYFKVFWTQLETVHLQGPCSLRPCSSRPYCTCFILFFLYFQGWEFSRTSMATKILLKKSTITLGELLMREVSIDCGRNTAKDFYSHLGIQKLKLK